MKVCLPFVNLFRQPDSQWCTISMLILRSHVAESNSLMFWGYLVALACHTSLASLLSINDLKIEGRCNWSLSKLAYSKFEGVSNHRVSLWPSWGSYGVPYPISKVLCEYASRDPISHIALRLLYMDQGTSSGALNFLKSFKQFLPNFKINFWSS